MTQMTFRSVAIALCAWSSLACNAFGERRPPQPGEPVTVDQWLFENYLVFHGRNESDRINEWTEKSVKLRLRDLSMDKKVTQRQLDRFGAAGYIQNIDDDRARNLARAEVIGKDYANLDEARMAYEKAKEKILTQRPGRFEDLRKVVYSQFLTEEQKKARELRLTERRKSRAVAAIRWRVALFDTIVPMSQEQREQLVVLITEEMPPAELYEDDWMGSVLDYAYALIPEEKLKELFEPAQLAMLKLDPQHVTATRENLRRGGILKAITDFRAAKEKAISESDDATK